MEALTATLVERVDELIRGRRSRGPLLSTTATSVAIAELMARTEALERALREIALEVQRLSASRES